MSGDIPDNQQVLPIFTSTSFTYYSNVYSLCRMTSARGWPGRDFATICIIVIIIITVITIISSIITISGIACLTLLV